MADFKQLEKVLQCKVPDRPVNFELFLNSRLYERACKEQCLFDSPIHSLRTMIKTFDTFGYDYAVVGGSEFFFHIPDWVQRGESARTISLNANSTIHDRESFDLYKWMDADKCDYSNLDLDELPSGMKYVVTGPYGVLENVIRLVGYDNLCMMIYDDEQLVYDIFEKVGSELLKYYTNSAKHDNVGALSSNDDWGFNTQTMLAPNDMRRFVFYWHKKIVDAIHDAGKYAILHSCGNYSMILDDLYALHYDGRHSYEDKIVPVEQAYCQFEGRMAVLGGLDINFLVRSTPEQIRERSEGLLKLTAEKGGYALGSGNSVPDYVPDENYFAMIDCVRKRY